MNDKISIIIAVYNSASYIERCLHSLFSQTYPNLEYIFVNDCTEDESVNIIKKVLKLYPHRKEQVKIISHDFNMGVSQARTTGTLKSTGDYIIHCDPDDYVEINWCEVLLKEKDKYNADIVICPYYIEDRNIRHLIKTPEIKKDGIECVINIFNNVAWRPLWNKLIKRSIIIDKNILFFKDCNIGEDWSLIIRCLNYSKIIVTVDKPLYHYCVRDNSLSNNKQAKDYLEPIEVFIKSYEFLDSCNNPRYEPLSDYFKFIVKMRLRKKFNNKIEEWFDFNAECHKSILKFKDHSFLNRIYLRLLLSNFIIYNFFMKFKKIKNSIFIN